MVLISIDNNIIIKKSDFQNLSYIVIKKFIYGRKYNHCTLEEINYSLIKTDLECRMNSENMLKAHVWLSLNLIYYLFVLLL